MTVDLQGARGAVRMVVEIRVEHESEWAATGRAVDLLGIGTPETVRKWCRQAEIDTGARPGVTSEDSAELKRLKRENAAFHRAPLSTPDDVNARPPSHTGYPLPADLRNRVYDQ
jgi:transposase-like protein